MERVVLLRFESGAGRGCGCQYFDLLNEAKNGILHGEKREQLLEMQGVRDLEHFPCPHCTGNKADWFVYQGVTYFENKYPGGAPRDHTQAFHSVSYLKDGEIRNVCHYFFKIKTDVGEYFSLD
jgi:hypothetical protein